MKAAQILEGVGFKILATGGTQSYLAENGVHATRIKKVLEGKPIEDAIHNRQVQIVINTTNGAKAVSDSKPIRRAALAQKVAHFTTIKGAIAAAQAIEGLVSGQLEVHPIRVIK